MTKAKQFIYIIAGLLLGVVTLIAGFSLSSSAVVTAAYSEDYKLDTDTISFSTDGYPGYYLYCDDSVYYNFTYSYTSSPLDSNRVFKADISIVDDCYVIRYYAEEFLSNFFELTYDSEFSLYNISKDETQYFSMDTVFTNAVSSATFEYDSASGYCIWTSPKISEHILNKENLVVYGDSTGSIANYYYKLKGLNFYIKDDVDYIYGSRTLAINLNVDVLGDWEGNKKDPDSRTDVLDDLKQAENFNEENYPLVSSDYSLDVIQIAESVDDEVFVYVYHPGGVENSIAKTINISRAVDDDDNLFVKVYNLELLSHTETLAKYCVNNLKVLDEETRYYKIISVSRAWIDDVDGEQSDDKVLKSIKVAKQYIITGDGDKLNYSVKETSVVVLDNVVSGFIRYSEGNTYNVGTAVFESCDSWFVAFDTDMKIDDLIAARVYYISRTCEETNTTFVGTSYKYGEKTSDDVYLTKYDSVHTTPSGDYKEDKYSWFRIQSVEAFLSENKDNLSDTLKSKLRGRQWILRYLETDYKNSQYSAGSTYTVCKEYTVVDEVTVIELKFESDGEIYNLGAVCDTISSPEEPDTVIRKDPNEDVDDFFSGIREWFESLGEGLATFFTILFWVIVAFLAYFVLKLVFSLISKIVDIFKKK